MNVARLTITVLTVHEENPLRGGSIADTLAATLERRGYAATAINLRLEGKQIAKVLQDAAIGECAQLLAMGGFGHTRVRDFVLRGATKGVLAELRIATLLAH